jgi:hypothetical protein
VAGRNREYYLRILSGKDGGIKMAGEKVKIWTMNAAADLMKESAWDLNWIFGWDNWEYGFRKDAKGNDTNQLMLEEEYFVPLAVKCIGRYFDSDSDELKKVKKYYHSKGQKNYKKFWTEGCGLDCLSRMFTKDFKGYYEMLKDAGRNHILIGYSLGGLTARYLAWMDEYVFGDRIIKGIITISSSNYGSPLANVQNKESAIDCILKSLWAMFSFTGDYFTDIIRYSQEKVDFKNIMDIIEKMNRGLLQMPISDKAKRSLKEFLSTSSKWLGGLSRDPNNAFFDLDINNLNAPYSMISLVNKHLPKKIYYGSIISSDNKVQGVIHSFVREKFSFLVSLFVNRFIDGLKLLDSPMQKNFAEVNEVYKNEVLKEDDKTIHSGNEDIRKVIERYEIGSAEIGLKPKTHDFIMPSSYQVLDGEAGSKYFLDNIVNPHANHNSGKSLLFRGGRENYKRIKVLLRKMK